METVKKNLNVKVALPPATPLGHWPEGDAKALAGLMAERKAKERAEVAHLLEHRRKNIGLHTSYLSFVNSSWSQFQKQLTTCETSHRPKPKIVINGITQPFSIHPRNPFKMDPSLLRYD